LFGPWGSFDCVKIVVRCVDEDDTSFIVPKVQFSGCTLVFPTHDVSYKSIEDSYYVFCASFGILEFYGRPYSMWLFSNIRNWYLDIQFLTQESGFEFLIVQIILDMWNSPILQILLVVWEGKD
jgi:hypothetical protein